MPMDVTLAFQSVHHMCVIFTESSKWQRIPWGWSYRWLRSAMWVQGIELQFSGEATSAPDR